MGTDTYGNYGPFCDAFDAENDITDPVHPPSPPVNDLSESEDEAPPSLLPNPAFVNHELIGMNTSCEERFALGNFDTVNECSAHCEGLGPCHYFLYDDNDGECVQTDSEGCPDARLSKSMYDMYLSLTPPPPPPHPAPVDDEFYTQIAEMSDCNVVKNTGFGYGFKIDDCAAMCLEDPLCYVFIFDPNDGDCRKENCGEDCPAPYQASPFYNMYRINTANPDNVAPEAET